MSQKAWKILLLLAWALLSLLSAVLLSNAQGQAREEIKERFEARAEVAARFTQTYARDLHVQERRVAARELSGAAVSSRDMQGVTNFFGYEAAVLLDASGRALRVAPEKAELVGQDLTRTYDHLRARAAGRTAVSKVVPSAAEGIPIVAFATPSSPTVGAGSSAGRSTWRRRRSAPICATRRQSRVRAFICSTRPA